MAPVGWQLLMGVACGRTGGLVLQSRAHGESLHQSNVLWLSSYPVSRGQ